MNLSVFLELIEVTSLSASAFPLMLGSFYAYYQHGQFNWLNTLLFFIAAILLQMTVNINDNYWDYKNATSADEFRRNTNVIGVNNLNLKLVGWLDFIFISISAILGLVLLCRTGWPLLILGIFSFAVGFFYAGGPYPINRTPFGEFLSGFTMGFVVILIAVYINISGQISLNWSLIWKVFLISGLSTCTISIMLLANTICDEEEDLKLNRKTLIYYIGKRASLNLVAALYILGGLMIIASVILGLLPLSMLLTFVVTPLVYKNVKFLFHNQVKREAFPKIAKNLAIISLAQVVSFAIGLIF